ncbi:MAG: ATP-binding protein, partial [Gammaproteobacteria bacterium]
MNTAEADLASRGNMPRNAPSRARKKNSLQPLLSNERSQKFDLLVHLISNIPDGIVICGPKGIGKSTMLDLLQAAKPENWLLCRISATNSTGFDDIMTTLANSFGANGGKPHPQSPNECLDLKLKQIRGSDQILVLLLDDAGEMAPGVISVVCQYAVSNPALRPVFTMTADRLHLTMSSDPAIANCQVIEIPPLSESQCGEFLKNLSGKPGALISFRAVRPA